MMRKGVFERGEWFMKDKYVTGDLPKTKLRLKGNVITFKQRMQELQVQLEQEKERRNREEKAFLRYFQLNKKALPLIDLVMEEKPKAFRLFLFLVQHMSKYNCVICSRTAFESALGTSRSTTYEYLKYMQELNMIYTEPKGKYTRYVVNPNIIWRSRKQDLKHCPYPTEKAKLDFPARPNQTYSKSGVLYVKSVKEYGKFKA